MNINGQDHDNPMEDIAKDMGRKVGNKAKEGGKALMRKVGKELKKVAMKVGKKVLAALGKALMKVIALAGKWILIIGAVLLLIAVCYYFLFESRGAEQNYSFDKDTKNETALSPGGYFVANTVTGKNKAIVDFYTSLGTNAYFQVFGDDNTKIKKPDGTIKDEYNREQEFSINPNFLFVLDEFLHQGKFKYPEQFLQPVNYDPDKMKLKDLINKDGYVIAESTKYDSKTGLKTKEKEKSVHDYGLATIFKYKEDEEVYTVEGNITKRDQWDDSKKAVVPETLATPEPFKEVMVGYPRKIYLIDKMVSFAQDVTFAYETTSIKEKDLEYGETTDPKQPLVKVKYGEYKEYESYECKKTDATGKTYTATCKRLKATHPLYEYREGGVFQTIPRPADYNNIEENHGSKYLEDYMRNYNAWIPEGVMSGFNFLERGAGTLQTDIELGAGDSKTLRNLWQEHFDLLNKYGTQYGVDPYLLLALWMAETSGSTEYQKDGPFQITGDGKKSVSATNVFTGQTETFSVYTQADRNDLDKAVHFAAMLLGGKIQKYGDTLKGLQAYNFDVSGYMLEKHPLDWEGTTWLNYREDARAWYAEQEYHWKQSQGNNYKCNPGWDPDPSDTLGLPTYGNACYLEHVLQYYIGDKLTDLESVDKDTEKKESGFMGAIKSFFGIQQKTYEETTPRQYYRYYMTNKEVQWTLKSIITFSDKKLFSETYTDDSDTAFWQDGFSTKAGVISAEQFVALVPNAEGFISPLNVDNIVTKITSMFGRRTHPITGERGKMHNGMDIGVPTGTPIYAVADATVEVADTKGASNAGKYVKLSHGSGIATRYLHMSEVYVKVGETVKQGQLIGLVGSTGGSTGPHLHFELMKNEEKIDPYNIIVRPDSYSKLPTTK